MIKDRYGLELLPGDECIIAKGGRVYRIKIVKETARTIQYYYWDASANNYRVTKPIPYSVKMYSTYLNEDYIYKL